MIMTLVTFTLVSTFAYSGNVPSSHADSQPMYSVRDDTPGSSKDPGPVQVSKAGAEKEPLSQLHQQLLAKEKEIAILRGKTAAATDLLNFEKNRAGALETQVAQQQLELKTLRNRGYGQDQISHDLVITKSSLDQAKQKIVDLERQLATSNLEHAKRRISELDRQLDAKDREIMAMRMNGDDKDKLKGDLASRTEELKQAKRHILGLEQELTQAKETLDKVNHRLTDLDSLLATRNGQLDQAKQLLASLQQGEVKSQDHSSLQTDDNISPRPASVESGPPTAGKEQPSVAQSEGLEPSGSDLVRLSSNLSSELRPELSEGGVSLRQVGNKLRLEVATGELFAPGESAVTDRGNSLLQRIGAVLQKFRYQTVEVIGHTDSTPLRNGLRKTFLDNGKLSSARAQQASQALISGGLQADRVKTLGHAATKPIATNDTEQGRSKNRRVEIIITQWSEPDDRSGNPTKQVSKKQQIFPTQKVAHR